MKTNRVIRRTLLGRMTHKDLEPEERRRLIGALFYGKDHNRLVRFWILLLLSVVIATFGLLTNSTAVVIGAMLLAPLMTPIIGFSAALVMVWPTRMRATMQLILTAVVFSIGLAYVITLLMPAVLFDTLPDEVLSRTAPSIADLFIALAAGGAGAFATVREDISASLPGVAIAVALIPPLSSVGIVLAYGDFDLAMGALLLFLTNLVSIILMAGLVFLATGFVPKGRVDALGRKLLTGLTIAAVAVFLVSIPLFEALKRAVQEAQVTSSATRVVDDWLGGGPFRVEELKVDDESVKVMLISLQAPPDINDLASALEDDLGRPIDVDVIWFQGDRQSLDFDQGGPIDFFGL